MPVADMSGQVPGKTTQEIGTGRFNLRKRQTSGSSFKYWRSPHWSYEFEYYFEIGPNSKLKEQLFGENKLRQVNGGDAAKIKNNVFGDAPSWFAPKDVAEYEVWVFK